MPKFEESLHHQTRQMPSHEERPFKAPSEDLDAVALDQLATISTGGKTIFLPVTPPTSSK